MRPSPTTRTSPTRRRPLLAAVATGLVLLTGATACGDDDGQIPQTGNVETTTTSETTTTTVATTTTQAGDSTTTSSTPNRAGEGTTTTSTTEGGAPPGG